jgi:hypothetical protein
MLRGGGGDQVGAEEKPEAETGPRAVAGGVAAVPVEREHLLPVAAAELAGQRRRSLR